MPIQAPTTITTPAAGEFRETTAAFRKTGPVEKISPPSDYLKKMILNGLGPVAPRVDELTKEGRPITVTTLRAAEIAAKIKRGETLTPSQIAQAQIAVRESLEVGLFDPSSPYYQQDLNLRNQRAIELGALHKELNGYLTGEARRPEDIPMMEKRWQLPFRLAWPPSFRSPRYETPGARLQHVAPPEDRPLTLDEIKAAESQSRIEEGWRDTRQRITNERYPSKVYNSLTPEEKRLVGLATSEELSRKFDDARTQEIIDEVKHGVSSDSIEDALKNGTDAEKRLARRAQKIEEDREGLLKKSKNLPKIKTMAEFQRFLGVDDTTLSQSEIAEMIIKELGIFEQTAINNLISNPDSAFARFFQEAGPLGTVTFVGKLFQGKLEKFAENRGVVPKPGERIAGQPPENLSRDALIGLTSEALALQMVDNKLTTDPVKYLTEQGIPAADAQKMVEDVLTTRGFASRNPDGSFALAHDKLGEWNDNDLAVLAVRGIIDINDPAAVADLRNKMDAALTIIIPDVGLRNREIARRITNIKDLARVNDPALPPAEQQKIIHNWDKHSLALLALLLGPLFATRIINSMAPNEQRAFQNMFA